MSLWGEADRRIRRLGLVDVKLAQIATFFLALVVAKLVPQLLSVSVWWFAVLCLACAAKPTFDFFAPRAGGSAPS